MYPVCNESQFVGGLCTGHFSGVVSSEEVINATDQVRCRKNKQQCQQLDNVAM